ncbi:MAG: hypothetical protein R3C26_09295 [Calditrichia bacterium]
MAFGINFTLAAALLAKVLYCVIQSVADKDWAQYTGALLVTTEPDEVYAYAAMGKDATGTTWFDNIDMTTDPWSMSLFNADAETPGIVDMLVRYRQTGLRKCG